MTKGIQGLMFMVCSVILPLDNQGTTRGYKTMAKTDDPLAAAHRRNASRTNPAKSGRIPVSTNFYSGRKSFGGKDGLGKFKDEHAPQFENDQRIDANSGDVPRGWMRGDDIGGGGGAPGISDNKPYFDQDKSRKGNDKPMMKGGENSSRNSFSSANNATSAESDWSADYKPTKHRG
jgi:hypothetical protein